MDKQYFFIDGSWNFLAYGVVMFDKIWFWLDIERPKTSINLEGKSLFNAY